MSMPKMLRYYLLVLKTAFVHLIDYAQAIIFVVLIIAGVAASCVPSLKMQIEWTGWQVAALILGSVIALRLVLAPFWIWQEQHASGDVLQQRLTAIGSKRDLAYDHVTFGIFATGKKPTVTDMNVTIFFTNRGTDTLKWRMTKASMTVNGVTNAIAGPSIEYYAPPTNSAWFVTPTLKNVPCSQYPLVVDVSYTIEYDNVPGVSVRTSERVTRYSIPSAKAQGFLSTDIYSDER
jgi:hypothetical protein